MYPQFLALLSEKGYAESTIEKYRWVINRLLSEAHSSKFNSLEDYYAHLEGKLSVRSMPEVKTYLGALKHFFETGVFHRDLGYRSGFMDQSSYSRLNSYYKRLVDNSIMECRASGRYESGTVKSVKSAGSVFCLYFQQHGHGTFESVDKQHIVLEYFHDGKKALRNSAQRYQVSIFLSANADSDPWCATVLSFLPLVPDFKKNFDYLKPEERVSIESVLASTSLTLRDKAIGILAYYAGLRSSEIANLTLDDIDLDHNRISIVSQQKTKKPLTLPLRPIVRDAICEYVKKERPVSADEHVFLTIQVPYKRLCAGSMANVACSIMDAAGIRSETGRRGLHLFRHAFASDLVSKDVPPETVSALLGHSSFTALDSYIDADIEHLRSCALGIEAFCESSLAHARMAEYHSGGSCLLHDVTEKLAGTEGVEPGIHRTLCSLDEYSSTVYPGMPLTQEIIDRWSFPMEGETRTQYGKRMLHKDRINEELSRYGLRVTERDSPRQKPRNTFPDGFVSQCRQLFEDFVAFQRASQHWCQVYGYALKSFDLYCMEHRSGTVPTQADIDGWSMKKESERLTSCGKRVAFLSCLCRYANDSLGTHLKAPDIPTSDGTRPIPHAFTDMELRNLFIACDNIAREHNSKATLMRKATVPALLRLMYSSGMRTKEVRMLDREDVDLVHGVIDIRRSKGHHEHRVALHPSMQEYLVRYDDFMNSAMPDRKCFFANEKDAYYSSTWLEWNFERMWYRFNGGHAVPYSLRHHYAIANINSWPADSDSFNKRLVYLSRSMGHATLESTMYYYSYTPAMAEGIVADKGETFRNVISGTY